MDNIAELIEQAQAYETALPAPAPLAKLPEGAEIAAWIDHTLLKPEATGEQIKRLCQEALQYQFASVCVNPGYVPLAAGLLSGSKVLACTVIGFPLGATLPAYKLSETLMALNAGAQEIDMVINVGALKSAAYGQVLNEVLSVVQVSHNQRAAVKVILETALLTRFEKILACLICKSAKADFVKTSTGFGPGGATVEDVDLMYRTVGPKMRVKASGGIRSLADAQAMLNVGAARLGTSAGVRIYQEALAAAGPEK